MKKEILKPDYNNESWNDGGLNLPDLKEGILIKRYKRFLADIILDNGEMITAHCPNSGSMKTCSDHGMRVWVSESSNPKRKLRFTWELIEMPGSIVGVNAILPNSLVKKAISKAIIPEIAGYTEIVPEITISKGTRLDLCLKADHKENCFIEIKNSTYVEGNTASFPDAVTTRGKKHLEELEKLALSGNRSIIFFLIQRMDADFFTPADAIDKEYGQALRKAHKSGVEILAYDTFITSETISIRKRLPIML